MDREQDIRKKIEEDLDNFVSTDEAHKIFGETIPAGVFTILGMQIEHCAEAAYDAGYRLPEQTDKGKYCSLGTPPVTDKQVEKGGGKELIFLRSI